MKIENSIVFVTGASRGLGGRKTATTLLVLRRTHGK